MSSVVTALYLVAALVGAGFATAELRMLARFLRNREKARALVRHSGDAPREPASLPTVTIQLPLFNERVAARRVIAAAAAQDYPRDRFDVQVLDDSIDETVGVVASAVLDAQASGVRAEQIRRDNRAGYKAGALAAGLKRSEAQFVAVFDADFEPQPTFLRRLLVEHNAFQDPRVAFVQARWGFDPDTAGVFHPAMALLLDRHFYIQKPARIFAGQVTTFNGSAGIWRRTAIDAAGGWSSDTLTEDLDLSYRCALAGWEGRYLHDVSVPNELPGDMRAFKLQQRRWSRGGAQCLRKLIAPVIDRRNRLRDRWEEFFLLAGYAIHPVLLANLLLWPWAVLYSNRPAFLVMQGLMSLATLIAPLAFVLTLLERGDRLNASSVRTLLAAIAIGIGLMVNNTIGQVQGFLTTDGAFARTPKGWSTTRGEAVAAMPVYASPLHWSFFAELALVAYCLASSALLVAWGEALWAVPLLAWGVCLALVAGLQFTGPGASALWRLQPEAEPDESRPFA